MEQRKSTPDEVIIDFEAKSLVVTPEIEASFPQVQPAFEVADQSFRNHPEAHLQLLEDSQFSFQSHGANVECSLIPGKGSEMLVIWAPFSDCAPRSSAEDIYSYMIEEDISKRKAAPNSWSQTTKSAATTGVLNALGYDMPVLTIYNVLPTAAYEPNETWQLNKGDFTPAGRIMSEAIAAAQEQLHGTDSETQISTLHIQGSSIGASNAVGSAYANIQSGERGVATLTTQELIMGPSGIIDLAKKFTIGGTVGKPSDLAEGKDYFSLGEIAEPFLRNRIDRAGNEPAMFGRMLLGMSKLKRNHGLTNPLRNETTSHLEAIAEEGVDVLIPLAENSGLTKDTPDYLPEAGEQVLRVCAVEGQHATHLIDEHVALTALATTLNIAKYKQ